MIGPAAIAARTVLMPTRTRTALPSSGAVRRATRAGGDADHDPAHGRDRRGDDQ